MLLDKWKERNLSKFKASLDSLDNQAEEITHSILRRSRAPAILARRLSHSIWGELMRKVMLILELLLLQVSRMETITLWPGSNKQKVTSIGSSKPSKLFNLALVSTLLPVRPLDINMDTTLRHLLLSPQEVLLFMFHGVLDTNSK